MTTMEEMSDAFRDVFKSERLVYTALEDTDRGRDFYWRCRNADLTVSGMIDGDTVAPPSRAASDKALKDNVEGPRVLLAVMVCLPVPADAATDAAADAEPEPIGFVILNKAFPRSAAFQVGFAKEHQNKGYGREAINWAVDHGFRWHNLHRLAIGCIGFNDRALHLYKDMGFTLDGRLRGCVFSNGRFHDLVEFSMLEDEWRKLRGITQ